MHTKLAHRLVSHALNEWFDILNSFFPSSCIRSLHCFTCFNTLAEVLYAHDVLPRVYCMYAHGYTYNSTCTFLLYRAYYYLLHACSLMHMHIFQKHNAHNMHITTSHCYTYMRAYTNHTHVRTSCIHKSCSYPMGYSNTYETHRLVSDLFSQCILPQSEQPMMKTQPCIHTENKKLVT